MIFNRLEILRSYGWRFYLALHADPPTSDDPLFKVSEGNHPDFIASIRDFRD